MKVVEIFKSIEGEGARAGFPVLFIRFEGCNLRCKYCDTKYSYEDAKFTEMEVKEIVEEVIKSGLNRVTLTGGEPLIQPEIDKLITSLILHHIEVNVETNGSVDISKLKLSNFSYSDKLMFTVDYKCPCSGMEDKMILYNLEKISTRDVLKFVVASKEDLDRVRDLYQRTSAQVFVSPVFGDIEPKEIVEYLLEHNMEDVRVQLQLHKIIWDPDKRGV